MIIDFNPCPNSLELKTALYNITLTTHQLEANTHECARSSLCFAASIVLRYAQHILRCDHVFFSITFYEDVKNTWSIYGTTNVRSAERTHVRRKKHISIHDTFEERSAVAIARLFLGFNELYNSQCVASVTDADFRRQRTRQPRASTSSSRLVSGGCGLRRHHRRPVQVDILYTSIYQILGTTEEVKNGKSI